MAEEFVLPTSPKFKNLSGQIFEHLTVLRYAGKKGKQIQYECLCDCGSITVAAAGNLRGGHTTSCGCQKGRIIHGMYKSGEYGSWVHMIRRCECPDEAGYEIYGGRGVTVFPEWRESFQAFVSHIGPRPTSGHSIDRIDSNGNYEPGNVRWATRTEQQNNRRDNFRIEFRGETKTVTEWARIVGINPMALKKRLKKWPLEIAMTAKRGEFGQKVWNNH